MTVEPLSDDTHTPATITDNIETTYDCWTSSRWHTYIHDNHNIETMLIQWLISTYVTMTYICTNVWLLSLLQVTHLPSLGYHSHQSCIKTNKQTLTNRVLSLQIKLTFTRVNYLDKLDFQTKHRKINFFKTSKQNKTRLSFSHFHSLSSPGELIRCSLKRRML